MIHSKLALQLAPKRRYKSRPAKKLCVQRLRDPDLLHNFQLKLDEELHIPALDTAEGEWSQLKQAAYKVTGETAGFRRRVHRDWFDDNDSEATALLDDMHQKHITWIKDKNSTSKKQLYQQARQKVQSELRQMKNI